jgi:hypothetical protein
MASAQLAKLAKQSRQILRRDSHTRVCYGEAVPAPVLWVHVDGNDSAIRREFQCIRKIV